MDILPKIFGNPHRVKLMRLFLFNPEAVYTVKDISKRGKISRSALTKEVALLSGLGFLKMKKTGRMKSWQLNGDFFFAEHFRSLFNAEFFANRADLAKKFKNCGKVKLLILSGVFMQEGGDRVDLLLVGDNLKKKTIEKTITGIEADIGRVLTYAILETADFNYRRQSSDKFIRDILDYPHKRILDKLEIPV